jgi:hypothetical protein
LSETGFIPILLSFIANPEILDSCDENEEQLLKMSINILHNVAQQPETKVTFREHRGSEVGLLSKKNYNFPYAFR